MIDPDNITTIRVDQLPEDTLALVNEFAHTNGTELKKATIQSLVDLVSAAVGAGSGVGFLPISVTDGQQLPDVPADPSFFLAGIGTYLNINGFPDLICTEELNAIMSLSDHWEIAVEIPINAEIGVQSVTGSAVDNTDPLNPIVNLSGGSSTTPTLQEVTLEGDRPIKYLGDYSPYSFIEEDRALFLICGDDQDKTLEADIFPLGTELIIVNTVSDFNLIQGVGVTITSPYSVGNFLIPVGAKLSLKLAGTNLWYIYGLQNYFEPISSSITASNGGNYSTIDDLLIDDPSIFLDGHGYIVHVIDGTTTIGGVDYTSGALVYRFYNGTTWISTDMNAGGGDIPSKTSDLINDGDDGNPFISLLDLPSNLTLFPTTVASDVVGYNKMVTSINDDDYDDTAVDVSTGSITGSDILVASLISSANLINGNPGVFNISTIGNIRRTSGSGTAEFYFKAYKRTDAGVETLVATSSPALAGTSAVYSQFDSSAIWDDGIFATTDFVVIKYYGTKIGGGTNPTYEFQFGGVTPVRTLVPIPLTVVPVLTIDAVPTDGSTNAVSSNGVFDAFESHDFETLINDQLAYFIPTAGVSTFLSLLRTIAPVLSGNTAVNENITNILFSTTATFGTLAFQRASQITVTLSLISKVNFYRKFKFNSNVTDTRFFCGISNMYGVSAPTNIEPSAMINSVGICKLSTSQNLHLIHNDASGTATTIDLGVNYPANNVVDYWYTLQILKANNSTNISVIVTRTDNTGASITSTTVISTDYNNSNNNNPAMWITNNATASIASYKDFGAVSKLNQLF